MFNLSTAAATPQKKSTTLLGAKAFERCYSPHILNGSLTSPQFRLSLAVFCCLTTTLLWRFPLETLNFIRNVFIKLYLSIMRQMKNLCLQRELKLLHDRVLVRQATCSCRIGWRKQPKTSVMLSFWRVKTKKRLGRKKPLIEPSQMSELATSLPVARWHTRDNLPPSFSSCFFSTAALDLFSSVGRTLDCRAGGPGFHSRGQTNTQGLKATEKNEGTAFAQQTTRTSCGLDDHVKWWFRL